MAKRRLIMINDLIARGVAVFEQSHDERPDIVHGANTNVELNQAVVLCARAANNVNSLPIADVYFVPGRDGPVEILWQSLTHGKEDSESE